MKPTTPPYGFEPLNWNSVLFRAMRTTPRREEKTPLVRSNALTALFRTGHEETWKNAARRGNLTSPAKRRQNGPDTDNSPGCNSPRRPLTRWAARGRVE